MKRFIIASLLITALYGPAALAGEIPVKAPAYTPAFSWTGFYIGGHVGGGGGKASFFDPVANVDNGFDRTNGVVGGGQLGLNYQAGSWVWGIEGQISATDLTGSHLDPASNGVVHIHSRVDRLGSIAGRFGYAWDRTLFYVKGGAAFAHDEFVAAGAGPGAPSTGFFSSSPWNTKMVGAGIEYSFAPHWSTKLEYNFIDFGSNRVMVNIIGSPSVPEDVTQNVHLVMIGVNYHFGADGVKY